MQFLDATFNNPKIKEYFEGTSELAPIGELLYVHSHFLENNFLSELEIMINETAFKLSSNPNSNKVTVAKFHGLTLEFGALLGEGVSNETGPEMLSILRDIYILCKAVK